MRLEDIKERTFSIAKEFRGQKMGVLGVSIILFMLILAIFAPILAPGVGGEWNSITRWEDNPRAAQPAWVDYILPGSRASHEIMEDPDEFDEDRMELTYNYQNDYDYPPSDVSVSVAGQSNRPTVYVWLTFARPDGREIAFASGERVSVFQELQFVERGDEVFDFGLDEFAVESYMRVGTVSDSLREAFLRYGIELDQDAVVEKTDNGWEVKNGIYSYTVLDTGEEGLYLDVSPEMADTFQLDPELEQDLNPDYIHDNISAAFEEVNSDLSDYATISSTADGWLIEDGIFSFNIDDNLVVSIGVSIGELFEFDMADVLYRLYFDEVGDDLRVAFSHNDFSLSTHATISDLDTGWFVEDGIYEFTITEDDEIEYGMKVDVELKEGELFTLDPDIEEYLEEGPVDNNVIQAFDDNGIILGRNAIVNETTGGWVIQDGTYLFEIDGDLTVQARMHSFELDVELTEMVESVDTTLHDNVTEAFDDNGISLSSDAKDKGLTELDEGWELQDGKYTFTIDTDLNVEIDIKDSFVFILDEEKGLEAAFSENQYTLSRRAAITESDDAAWMIEDRVFNYTVAHLENDLYSVQLSMRDMFQFDLDYKIFLEEGTVRPSLIDLFDENGITLSDTAEIVGQDEDGLIWHIKEGEERYYVEDLGNLVAQVYYLNPEEYVFIGDIGDRSTATDGLIDIFTEQGLVIDSDTMLRQWDTHATEWWIEHPTGFMAKIENDGMNIYALTEFVYSFTIRSKAGRESVYNFGLDYHDENEDIPMQGQINSQDIPFANAEDGNILLNPQSLKGEYTLTVRTAYASSFDDETTRVIFRGRKYGLMGTDTSRRDIALGWVWGARWALMIGAIISITTVTLGLLYGMTSAYYGGWVDEFMQRLNEVLIGIPMFPILIITMFIMGRSIWIFVGLYTLLGWRGLAKIIRSRGIQIRQDTYIEAAQSLGSSGGRIITKHMIPQLLPYGIAEGALLIPLVIIAEAGLSVLGLGDPNVVTWGRMLSQAHSGAATTQGLWWWVLLPGLGITLVGFGFIATGMALERVINPKMRQR
ncbi:MAG: ABC transporter permease [Thermoplasmata archaeon]